MRKGGGKTKQQRVLIGSSSSAKVFTAVVVHLAAALAAATAAVHPVGQLLEASEVLTHFPLTTQDSITINTCDTSLASYYTVQAARLKSSPGWDCTQDRLKV